MLLWSLKLSHICQGRIKITEDSDDTDDTDDNNDTDDAANTDDSDDTDNIDDTKYAGIWRNRLE